MRKIIVGAQVSLDGVMTEFVHALLANDLVDAISTFTVPAVFGGGKKLFADGSALRRFSEQT